MTNALTPEQVGDKTDDAARTATAIPQFTESFDLSLDDAYAAQAHSIGRRLGRGEQLVGVKMGLTSRAKMVQVGVDEVIWGRLTDAMRLPEGGVLERSRYVHPRVEPEIAFLIGEDIDEPLSAMEAMARVDGVAAAAEIIDSRYENFKFALPDVVADNSSSSSFFVGDWHLPDTPVDNLGIVLDVDGRPAEMGSSAAILGNPVRSLVEATRMVTAAGLTLEAGWVVLAGGATAAVHLEVGHSYRVTVETLGAVQFTVAD